MICSCQLTWKMFEWNPNDFWMCITVNIICLDCSCWEYIKLNDVSLPKLKPIYLNHSLVLGFSSPQIYCIFSPKFLTFLALYVRVFFLISLALISYLSNIGMKCNDAMLWFPSKAITSTRWQLLYVKVQWPHWTGRKRWSMFIQVNGHKLYIRFMH